MGGQELELSGLGPVNVPLHQQRKAAVHIADRIAAEHPELTATEIAADPAITAGFRELLAAIGLHPDTRRTT